MIAQQGNPADALQSRLISVLASQNRNEIETRTVIDGKKKDNRNEKTD